MKTGKRREMIAKTATSGNPALSKFDVSVKVL